MKDKYILFYTYPDSDPYIIVNPPDNLYELLSQWQERDRKGIEQDGIITYLMKNNVVFAEKINVYLDSY